MLLSRIKNVPLFFFKCVLFQGIGIHANKDTFCQSYSPSKLHVSPSAYTHSRYVCVNNLIRLRSLWAAKQATALCPAFTAINHFIGTLVENHPNKYKNHTQLWA